ncbi:MAG TPA: hypothetical protein DCR14_08840 [Acidimicrobiaceae bacterium]|nr:hypothetical protein [Acidimicrobiaceae bacterium]
MNSRRRFRGAASGCLLACGLVLAACGFPTETEPVGVEMDELTSPTSETTPPEVPIDIVTVWFARDGELAATTREVPTPVLPDAVVAALGAGVTDDEAESGLRSAIPSASMLLTASAARGTVTVQLSSAFAEIPVGDQSLALAQVVFTLTELRGVGRVRFQIDGEPIAVPLPDGTSTEDSVSRDDFLGAAAG